MGRGRGKGKGALRCPLAARPTRTERRVRVPSGHVTFEREAEGWCGGGGLNFGGTFFRVCGVVKGGLENGGI